MKSIHIIICAVVVSLLFACSPDDFSIKKLGVDYLGITDLEADSAGTQKELFFSERDGDSYLCRVTTDYIRSCEWVDTITAECEGSNLTINIGKKTDTDTYMKPYDRRAEVKFKLYGMPKGEYRVKLIVGSIQIQPTPEYHQFN